MRLYTSIPLVDNEIILVMLHSKQHQEEISTTLDHQLQKNVLRAVDDVELELVANVRMTSNHDVEESPLILRPNQICTWVHAHEWPCRPKCTYWTVPFVWLVASAAYPSQSCLCDRNMVRPEITRAAVFINIWSRCNSHIGVFR